MRRAIAALTIAAALVPAAPADARHRHGWHRRGHRHVVERVEQIRSISVPPALERYCARAGRPPRDGRAHLAVVRPPPVCALLRRLLSR